MSLIHELRRRNVIRVAGLYLVGAWLVTQVAGTVLPMFGAPDWLPRSVVILIAIGFVPALIFAWVFELTPEGLKRDAEVKPEESIALQTARRMDRMIIAVLAIALAYFAFDKFVLLPRREAARELASESSSGRVTPARPAAHLPENDSDQTSHPIPTDSSIAVLPFVNMSSDKEQEYFSDGLSEELLNLLAQLPQLRVIARTSSFSFKGKETDVATIAKALNVANVLEGSVRKSGNTLRITAQLIRTVDSSHLWSQTYDRELTDVFKVQDEIAGEVVGALKVRLLADQVITNEHRSSNVEAYTQYLIGKNAVRRGTFDNWLRANPAFQQAITLDGNYAAAYAALAANEYRIADRLGDTAGMEAAFAHADKAIALAPNLLDGYLARATIRIAYKRDWAGAQADIEKALALSPGDVNAHLGHAGLLRALGSVPEAIAAARKGIEFDPVSAAAWVLLGRLLNATPDHAAARQALDRALQLAPESEPAHFHRAILSLIEGRAEEALVDFGKSGTLYGSAGVALAEHTLGHAAKSEAALQVEIADYAKGGAYQIAQVYAWRGEADKAFEWLDRGFDQHDGGLTFMRIDPLFAAVRTDPRYAALLKKMGLPP
jgi:TolB-like protein